MPQNELCRLLMVLVFRSVFALQPVIRASSPVFACVCLQAGEQMGIPLTQQASNESRLSMSESVSEFFDAQEVLLSASSSENEVLQLYGFEKERQFGGCRGSGSRRGLN